MYQVYVRSFADSDGDGVGDLAGLASRLDYVSSLGVDGLWLTPFYRSPMVDGGYDVADPREVDPSLGDLATFDRLVEATRAAGLRLTVDVVPNHTSVAHRWFQAAQRAGRGSAERRRYLFRDGAPGRAGSSTRPGARTEPPNNWLSVFGGSAWTQVADGQWYLHLFAPEQPDLDWTHPEVWADLQETLRCWLARGVDGFRIDVAHGMAKAPGLPDMVQPHRFELDGTAGEEDPRFDQPAVHDIHRRIRGVLDEHAAMAVGEVWVRSTDRLLAYVRPDELNLVFTFGLLAAPWDTLELRAAIEQGLRLPTPAWCLANHDRPRTATRYGGGAAGRARARAAALLMLALPGACYLYAGEELGLPDVELPDDALTDPTWERSGHTDRGRDGCRVPLPWSGSRPPFGFGPGRGQPWLPQPPDWGSYTVARQDQDPDSTLSLYRRAIRIRASFAGEPFAWRPAPDGILAFDRGRIGVVVNCCPSSFNLEENCTVLVASGPMQRERGELVLPADSAVWLDRSGG